MTEEQITNRYVRGWISLSEYRAEMVKLYDRLDAIDAKRAFLDINDALDHDPTECMNTEEYLASLK